MKVLFYTRGDENLGIQSLSAVLKKAGHQTELIFDFGFEDIFFFDALKKIQNTEKLLQQALEYNPDLIAISSTILTYHAAKLFAQKLRERKFIPTIIGGPHATACPDEVVNEDFFDMVLMGEGEEAFLELVNSYGSEKKYDIRNVWFKLDGEIIKNPLRPLIQDLDSIPFLDKALFYRYGVINDRLSIICSRGCFYSCNYCTHSYTRDLYRDNCVGQSGNMSYERLRSPQSVLREIIFFIKKYRIKFIRFWDEMFGHDFSWLNEFSKDYIKYVDLPFACTMHPFSVKDETIALLKKANCRNITIGVESGSPRIREAVLNRWTPDAALLKAAEIIKRHKIGLLTENIFCLPKEEKEDMEKTVRLNLKMKPKNASAFIFFPFPKTKLFSLCLKNGLLNEKMAQEIILGSPKNNSWNKESILSHPHKDFAWRLKILFPLAVRWPKLIYLFEKLTRIKLFRQLLFCLSLIYIDNTEFRQKLKDYFCIFKTAIRQGRL